MKMSQVDNKPELKTLKAKLEQIEGRLIKSQDLMLDDMLEPAEYVNIKARHLKEKKDIKEKIADLKTSTSEFVALLESGIHLLENVQEAYTTSSINLKHKIVGSIFMEQLSFDGKKCRTPKLNRLFDLLPNMDKGLGKLKRGQVKEIFNLSPSAERGGFEPPLRYRKHAFQACAFSHSATFPYYSLLHLRRIN